mmetsp:Transcript_6260/g.18832  ORF Transcript_6260/g.18832 Transcript_6260/m.18832 type:complete len:774 (+) Transcript_6260:39-2360(+)
MHVVHRDLLGRAVVHVQAMGVPAAQASAAPTGLAVGVAGPHGHAAGTGAHAHCAEVPGTAASSSRPSRQSPNPRVLAGGTPGVQCLPLRPCQLSEGAEPLLVPANCGRSQAPPGDLEARRKRDRWRSMRQCPETSLPSSWSHSFDLNPEEPLLGGGAFAKILRVVERSTGQGYAMKVMSRPNFAMRGIEMQVDAEIEAMRRCAQSQWCRHVVRLCDVTEENDYVYIRLELCSCDLLRFANNQPSSRLQELDAAAWTRQLITGLKDLHCLGILHRDIKPENLLCTADGTLKIADFGWCADLQDAPSTMAGTFQYMAPEILGAMGVQTEAVDFWSAGVTMIQLLNGSQLLLTYLGPGSTALTFTDPHQATKVKTARLLAEIGERCPPPEESRPAHLSRPCWDLLRKMLTPEVERRISASEALDHPWLREAPGQGRLEGVPRQGAAEAKEQLADLAPNSSMPILQVPTPMRAATPARSPRQSLSPQPSPPTRPAVRASPQPSPDTRPLCRRSESAPKQLHSDWTPMGSSRQLPSDPPSPHHVTKPHIVRTVYRSQTGERWAPVPDNVCTLEASRQSEPEVRKCRVSKRPELEPAAPQEPVVRLARSLRRASFASGEELKGPVLCKGSPSASRPGSACLPSTTSDMLSRTSPLEVLKTSTPGIPPLRSWRENEPAEANRSPPRAQYRAAGDSLLCRAVVLRPWQVAGSPGLKHLHTSSVALPLADRSWFSPRLRTPTCGARTSPTASRLATPYPETFFRDVGAQQPKPVSMFGTVTC